MAGGATLIHWFWDDIEPRPGWQQMAIDRALADLASARETSVWRLYRWAEPTISFGANEAARKTWDRTAIERDQIGCVRRPTGGRGVWHDTADLTYAVTAPLASMGGLRLAYRVIHEQLARALATAGQDTVVAPQGRKPTLDPGACFDAAIGGEVLLSGRKAVGSAQAVIGTALLQHGAIALADRQPALARFRLGQPGMALGSTPGAPLTPEGATAAILSEWRANGADPIPASAIADVTCAAQEFAAHFRDPAWTWRR